MFVLTQNSENIVNINAYKSIEITPNNIIIAVFDKPTPHEYIGILLGRYTEKGAREIIFELLKKLENGSRIYIMPKEF